VFLKPKDLENMRMNSLKSSSSGGGGGNGQKEAEKKLKYKSLCLHINNECGT
jgi:hypothetical protein